MRRIAISNRKGGTGKTTTTVNLAAALAELGRRVLVVDLDAQANSTRWLGCESATCTLVDELLDDSAMLTALETGTAGVDLVAGGQPLAGVERVFATEIGPELLLRRKLDGMSSPKWDYVLMDCPPSFGILQINAWVAARELLVPVEAHMMAVDGLVEVLRNSEQIRTRVNPDLRVLGVLACRFDSRTRHGAQVVETLRRNLDEAVFTTVVRENVRVAEAYGFRQPITRYDPQSAGAIDHRALAAEVEARGENHDGRP